MAVRRRERRPFMRIALRRKIREARKAGDTDTVKALRTVLLDRDVMNALLVNMAVKYDGLEEMREQALGDGTFLQFILDNWEEILELILSIIAMFL